MKYNDWQLGNDFDSVEFMLDGGIVQTEYLEKIVEDWAENKKDLEKV